MFFGKRRERAHSARAGRPGPAIESELYVVAYESMLKGNKLMRRGRPIRQVAIVVDGTVRLITSGDAVDRHAYEALIGAGVLPAPGLRDEPEAAPPVILPDPEVQV